MKSFCFHRDKTQPRPLSSTADMTEAQREQQELQLLTPKQVKGLARRANRKQKEQEQRSIVEARPSALRVSSRHPPSLPHTMPAHVQTLARSSASEVYHCTGKSWY